MDKYRKDEAPAPLPDAGPPRIVNVGARVILGALGLEGIVSKRKDSRYFSGRSPYWLAMKNPASAPMRREADEDREPQLMMTTDPDA